MDFDQHLIDLPPNLKQIDMAITYKYLPDIRQNYPMVKLEVF